MWYPASVTTPAAGLPFTLDAARAHARMDGVDDDLNTQRLCKSAVAYVEKYTGTRLATQTLTKNCDAFADFCRIPEAPVQSITSISYVDAAGAPQTLDPSVYELRSDGLDALIRLKFGQQWPPVQPGSRITVVMVAGYVTAPDDVVHALLMWVSQSDAFRESIVTDQLAVVPDAFTALLSNHRIGL